MALQRSYEALTLAQNLSHPLSLTLALLMAANLHQSRGEEQATRERVKALIALSREQNSAFSLAVGTILWGRVLGEREQGDEGIAQMRHGLAAHQATEQEAVRPYFLALLAEGCGKAERVEEGLSVLADALDAVQKTGERHYEAELYRIKGELLLMQESKDQRARSREQKLENLDSYPYASDPQGEAEACFLKAIDIAQKQQAKSLELRAATSLARLWQRQGKNAEAHKLLSEVYNWFTEGFDTKDLQEAKALLESLNRNPLDGKCFTS